MSKKFSHIDSKGNPSMVNVGEKAITRRQARALAFIELGEDVLSQIEEGELHTKKGAVFQTAIIAGVFAAKKTSDLIPLCHPLALDNCQIQISIFDSKTICVECTTDIHAKTGVEMEALTGATIAALTIYDMCKSISSDIIIKEIMLIEKSGGKNDFVRDQI